MSENPLDYAYIAGFVDGEGWIGFVKGKNKKHKKGYQYHPGITIGNTNREVLGWMQSIFGGSLSIRKSEGNQKEAYVLTLSSRQALNMAQKIRPFIRMKKQQIDLLIEVYEKGIIRESYWGYEHRRDSINGRFTAGPCNPSKERGEYYALQEEYYLKFKELNQTGLTF